jgi:tRNA(adenine34) deaminase
MATNHSTEDLRYMQIALAEAQKAYDMGEIPVGCIIVADNQIVGRGHNLTETLQDVTAHAEIQAITAAASTLGGKYLTQCTLYVTLEPCAMCAGAIGWAQIRRVVYGATDDKRGFTRFAPQALHPKCTISTGVMEEECKQLVQTFFRNKR